jgi:predicted O-linked N-acetylglucosamine transferase (SPINDLY family)
MSWLGRLLSGRSATPAAASDPIATPCEPEPEPDPDQAKAEADRLWESGQLDAACEAYASLLARHPDHGRAWNNYGLCLRQAGRFDAAHQAFVQATHHSPDLAAPWINLAVSHEDNLAPTQALLSLDQALALDPGSRDAINNRAQLLASLGRTREAEAQLRAGLALHPDDVGMRHNLGLALSRQGRADEALTELRRVADQDPRSAASTSPYLLALNYADSLDPSFVGEEHRRVVAGWRVTEDAQRRTPQPRRAPLRVGYVSADFGFHVVSFFIEPVLAAHDRTRVEAVCYFTGAREDAQCARIRATGVGWRPVAGLSDDAITALMRQDALDVVVDLSGHTSGHLLPVLARRVAPVQLTWLGYPNTTGVPAVDVRLTDALADPPGLTEAFHGERLHRLEPPFLVYRPRPEAPPVGDSPCLARGHVTFASFNNAAKISAASLGLWARILQRVPDARLLLKSNGLDEPALAADLRQRFAALGGDPDRLDLQGQQPTLERHLACYGEVDIALDTTPYAGTTTTCEALWMGVPVVSLAGACHAARVGASLLASIGRPDWVAATSDAYVDIATALAADRERLRQLRASLRQELATSPLTDAAAFTRRLEAAFEALADEAGART